MFPLRIPGLEGLGPCPCIVPSVLSPSPLREDNFDFSRTMLTFTIRQPDPVSLYFLSIRRKFQITVKPGWVCGMEGGRPGFRKVILHHLCTMEYSYTRVSLFHCGIAFMDFDSGHSTSAGDHGVEGRGGNFNGI